MRKVLVISYNFPPDSCGPVQRVTKFCKYLPRSNWQPIVLTASGYRATGKDHRLLEEVKPHTKIIRKYDSGNLIPGEIRNRFNSLNTPDKRVTWVKKAVNVGKSIINNEGIGIVFTTSPPHSVQMVGLELKSTTGIKWVADFRDEWTFNPDFRKKENREIQKKLEKSVLINADRIICNTWSMEAHFKQLIPDDKYVTIPNGFDDDDFKELIVVNSIVNNHPRKDIVFVYAGRLSHLHSPLNLLKAFRGLLEEKTPGIQDCIIKFISNPQSKRWLEGFEDLERAGIIEFTGFLDHQECLKRIMEADISVLLASNSQGSDFIPGKLYEYLYVNHPVLCVVPCAGMLSEFLGKHQNCLIAYDNSVSSIKNVITKAIKMAIQNRNTTWEFNTNISQYSRRELTGQLSKVFNDLVVD